MQGFQRTAADILLAAHQVFDLGQEPGVDPRHLVNVINTDTLTKCISHIENAFGSCFTQFALQVGPACFRFVTLQNFIESIAPGFQAAQCFLY